MPTVAYYERKPKEGIEVVRRVKVQVKDLSQALAVKDKRGFIRYCTGLMTIEEVIARRKQESRSDWYA